MLMFQSRTVIVLLSAILLTVSLTSGAEYSEEQHQDADHKEEHHEEPDVAHKKQAGSEASTNDEEDYDTENEQTGSVDDEGSGHVATKNEPAAVAAAEIGTNKKSSSSSAAGSSATSDHQNNEFNDQNEETEDEGYEGTDEDGAQDAEDEEDTNDTEDFSDDDADKMNTLNANTNDIVPSPAQSHGGQIYQSHRSKLLSIITKPGILAGIVGGAIIGILTAILLIMFIVYRMRKKDEGSYALEESKKPLNAYDYRHVPTKEFYA